MQIENILNQAQSSAIIGNLANAFGIDPAKAENAIEFMLQTLADRIERNTFSRAGVAEMVELLGRPQAGRAYNDPESLAAPQMAEIGNYVLDVLYGSKHMSRGIARRAAGQSGIDEETAKRLWPVVASVMIGALQAKTSAAFSERFGGLAAVSGRSPLPLPGEAPSSRPTSSPSPSDWDTELPKPAGGAGGGMGGTVGRSPLPVPGDDIPGINDGSAPSRFPDLPDIIRRGGTRVPGPSGGESGGGSLEDVIRQILGNLLGFQNGGIMSWIVKLLLSRWFMGLVRRIFSRMLVGR